MKRILLYGVLAALTFSACSKNDEPAALSQGGDIILGISTGKIGSRADIQAESTTETRVDILDILIYDQEGVLVYNERFETNGADQGRIILNKKRTDFDKNVAYWVYLIANSTYDEAKLKTDAATLANLKLLTQTDPLIHMTGNPEIKDDVPQHFLMDAVAYTSEQEPDAPSPVILRNDNDSDNTELMATLRRAAAKFRVTVKAGINDKGELLDFYNHDNAGFYVRNMPYKTYVVDASDIKSLNAELRTPTKHNGSSYFKWTDAAEGSGQPDEIVMTGYLYAHDWSDPATPLNEQPRLVVNIPLKKPNPEYNPDEEGSEEEEFIIVINNWYQIPISREKLFERNHFYEVRAEVKIEGAVEESKPLPIGPIDYSVVEWGTQDFEIGGDDEAPHFLVLNTDEMEMYNIDSDETTLHFASSSDVTVEVMEAWFINKMGLRRSVSQDIFNQITATPDKTLSGNITIKSPIPVNNTIRYIRLKVTNQDTDKELEVIVAQYPLTYITNIRGWYSYRSDLGNGKTNSYEYLQDIPADRVEQVITEQLSADERSVTANDGSGFQSRVATSYNEVTGQAELRYYRWRGTGWGNNEPPYSLNVDRNASSDHKNGRMYHVRIMASSGEYTLGRPRLTNGVTDSGKDNAKIVSPSFMIASQLGVTNAISDKSVAEGHCKAYVEVYQVRDANGRPTGETKALSGWRLPTKAEVAIILDVQDYKNNAEGGAGDDFAIDLVMKGDNYWSANGRVNRDDPYGSPTGRSANIRCIRDAFDTEL